MKIAVCFSGQIRTGSEASENIKNFLGDLLPNCDFFLHTWNTDYHNTLSGESYNHYEKIYNGSNMLLDLNKISKLKEIYNFKNLLIDDYWLLHTNIKEKYSEYTNDTDHWWFPLWYSWYSSIQLKKQYEDKNNFKYDIVIKLRPDIIFSPELKLENYLSNIQDNSFGINRLTEAEQHTTVDDILFISKSPVADIACKWWEHRIINKEHMHGDYNTYLFFYNYLKDNNLIPFDLGLHYLGKNEKISLLRQECTYFNPITEFDKCRECDKIHYHSPLDTELGFITQFELQKLAVSTLERRDFLPRLIKDRL